MNNDKVQLEQFFKQRIFMEMQVVNIRRQGFICRLIFMHVEFGSTAINTNEKEYIYFFSINRRPSTEGTTVHDKENISHTTKQNRTQKHLENSRGMESKLRASSSMQ